VFAAKGLPARLCSTGEQTALLISLVLANAAAVAAEAGAPVLLLDEVAAHLDAGRREALYGAVARLGAQAWMTGTGAELFDGLEAQRLQVSEVGGESRVERV
jgi:DNA replication and repair protein RecF